jgi:hypothetical protein
MFVSTQNLVATLLQPFFGGLLADSAFYGFLLSLQTRENPA